jgi:hypothetical protein
LHRETADLTLKNDVRVGELPETPLIFPGLDPGCISEATEFGYSARLIRHLLIACLFTLRILAFPGDH